MAEALKLLDEMIQQLETTLTGHDISPNHVSTSANVMGTQIDRNVIESSEPKQLANDKKKELKKENAIKPKEENDNKNESIASTGTGTTPEQGDAFDVNALDLRVGIIRKVYKHETAEKLYCEEIDVGEPEFRQIASGLVKHYTLEEIHDRKVVVICNLKPRNLVGFKSYGMVFCAVKAGEDGEEIVELLAPPEDARAGERIVGDGLTGAPLTASQVDKKKVFEKVATDLRVVEGRATWKGIDLLTESGGKVLAPTLKDGLIR